MTQIWSYQPALHLDRTFVGRMADFPREPDMLAYGLRMLSAAAIRAYLGLYHRLSITGRHNLDVPGSFVLVANHASHLDTLCLLAALPLGRLHQAFPAAATDYFFVSHSRLAIAVLAVNALPFDRSRHVRHSIQRCRQLLSEPGNILILYPEGTRTTTGAMGAFKPGIGKLVAGLDVPVIPCFLQGAFKALPKGNWLPRPRKL